MANNNNKNNSQGITLKRWQLMLIAAIVLVVIIVAVVVAINWSKWFGGKDIESTEISSSVSDENASPDLDPNAADWDEGSLADKTAESGASEGIKIPGYPSINLPAGTKDVQIALLNPEGNPCYFTFEIVLDDTNETIYKSKQVAPCKAVTDLTLTKALDEGTYNATIKITTNSLEDMSPMNGANVQTQLIVQ